VPQKWVLFVFGIFVVLAGWLASCGGSAQTPAGGIDGQSPSDAGTPAALAPASLGAGKKLRVVATTSIVADVVSNVGGDEIELTGLLPIGADPHTYQATPQDLRAVADAHVIFANGAGLEAFLDEMLRNAGGNAPVVHVSEGIEFRELSAEAGHDDAASEDHAHADVDPHTWFDPNNVIVWVDNVERALSQLDPAHTDAYQANAEAYRAALEELDAWIRQQVSQVPAGNRKLVTDHLVLGYFADEYGFEQIGAVIGAFSTVAEPSAQQIAALEDDIRRLGVPAVFVSTTVNPKVSERVAQDTGVRLVRLYTGSLTEPAGEAGTYLDFMRYDVNAIVSALR
jgi:ABC-type Zn uptake system ZnuABC Zn-binding protein ZnuA